MFQGEKAKSDSFEKHLKMVLAESCEDEKQRKHNNKRLVSHPFVSFIISFVTSRKFRLQKLKMGQKKKILRFKVT